jgi:hypothetical protein
MATNTVDGILVCSDGFQIPLQAEILEGTETSLTTSTAYTITAQAAGTYAQNRTVVRGLVTADNSVSYAYVLSEGLIAALIPIGVKGQCGEIPMLCKPYTLKAGDQVRVLTLTTSARNAALMVYTNTGTERIFTNTASGGATQTFTDLQTSNGLGETLQGQSIIKAMFTCVDGSKVETPGTIVLDAQNNILGSVPMVNPQNNQPMMNASNPIPVNLNYSAKYLTNA